MQVGTVALEERMCGNREENVQVTCRTAAHASLAFAREANARAILDAGRDVDRQRAIARGAADPAAGRARIVDHLTAPLAAGARSLQREKALRMADAAGTAAMRASLRLAAGL